MKLFEWWEGGQLFVVNNCVRKHNFFIALRVKYHVARLWFSLVSRGGGTTDICFCDVDDERPGDSDSFTVCFGSAGLDALSN